MVLVSSSQFVDLLHYKLLVLKKSVTTPDLEYLRLEEIKATENLIEFHTKNTNAETKLIERTTNQMN